MIKRFISFYRPHKFLFILDIGVAFLTSILNVVFPTITRRLFKEAIPEQNIRLIITFFSVLLVIWITKASFNYIRVKWGHILGVRIEADMRAKLFRHLQKLSFTYYDNTKTGHIMSRITNDLNIISEVAHHAPEDLIISLFTILGSFILMFKFNSSLAWFALIPLPIIMIWGLTLGRRMKSGFREVRKKIADMNSSVENSVQGIREVKSYANELVEIEKFGVVNRTFRMAKERMYTLMSFFFAGMGFLTDLYYGIVIGAGTWLILKGSLDIADLLVFILYINFILNPINRLINFVEQYQQGTTAFERFTEIMDIEPDIQDVSNPISMDSVVGNIEIKDLSFKYSNTDINVLKGINITIPAGKTVALVGESGAGKSTLVSLLPRFYEAEKGEITIDGENINRLKQKFLREKIGLVQQSVFLFDTTIRDNILYGKPEATDSEVIEAARKANILEFIMSLPHGLDTLVGERGVKLSGGQKQRISIARVFLKNPPILIFDEATSSLDTESEEYIQKALEELSAGRTTIIIAHRLSTVANADYTYVMQNGEVVEEGVHAELVANKGYYHNLCSRMKVM
ncbi:MAG: thiamine ABC transporter permease [Candidatus Cloacimonetes bacterium 4572_65]|nr:MAG: thiamine ABC transporter permease [Candidatus Cloacimonetes bacterium 4572_65]